MTSTRISTARIGTDFAATACAPHGRPASRTAIARFRSRPGWIWLTVLLSPIVFLLAASMLRRTARNEAWPMCRRCVGVRRWRIAATALTGVVATGLLAAAGGSTVPARAVDYMWAGIGLGAVACAMAPRTRVGAVARAHVTRDGEWVVFRRAHPAFDAEV